MAFTDTDAQPFTQDAAYFVQTVTHFFLGNLKDVYPKWLVLENASWVVDAGDFEDFLGTGSVSELRMHPKGDVIVNRDSVLQVVPWAFALPTKKVG